MTGLKDSNDGPEFDGSFTVTEFGVQPNACFPCHECGEPTFITVLHGDPEQMKNDPTLRFMCEGCWSKRAEVQ